MIKAIAAAGEEICCGEVRARDWDGLNQAMASSVGMVCCAINAVPGLKHSLKMNNHSLIESFIIFIYQCKCC